MATIFKALKRPATFKGVPIVPLFFVVSVFFLIGLYTNKFAWLLILIAYFPMRYLASKDEQIFNLYFLKIRTLGNLVANKYFKVNSTLANNYDPIYLDETLKNMRLSDRKPFDAVIPFSSHIDDFIVKNKEGDLISTWQIAGSDFDCKSLDDLELLDEQFATFIKSFSGTAVTFYTHNCRDNFYDNFDSKSGNFFADLVSEKYYEGIKNNQFLKNNIYFTVVFKPFSALQRRENKTLTLEKKQELLNDNIKAMNEIRERFNSVLSKYTSEPLGLFEENNITYSSQLSFYNFLISGTHQKIRVLKAPIYKYLGSSDVFIGHDTGEIIMHTGKRRFFRSIELKEFTDDTVSWIFDALLFLNVSYVLTQSFSVMSKNEALANVKNATKQLRSAEDDAVSQQLDLQQALDDITAGKIVLGKHHYSLIVYADSIEELRKDTNNVISMLSDIGFVATLSTLSLTAAFYSQMPSVFNLRPRLSPISNINYTNLASFHNFYQGKRDKNCWGEAVAIMKTPSKQPYYLNFHNSALFKNEEGEKNLANTSVIGASGAGKTMLLSFIQNMLQKYAHSSSFNKSALNQRLTTVFFDKDRGAEINIKALGGSYYVVKNGEATGWNPFYLENTKRNRNFIRDLIRILVTRNGEKITASQETLLSNAINSVMAMPREYRKFGITRLLEHLPTAATVEDRDNGLAARLKIWSHGEELGWVFDNEIDTLDLNTGIDNIGIDGTEFLDNKDVCTPISFYLLYRVTQLLDGRRLVLFFDEFWMWLADVAFKDFVYNKLKTIRKLNGFIIAATQSPDEILKNEISAAVIEQCATQIFLPNPKATKSDYVDGFKTTEEEFTIIKELDVLSRQFIVKKSGLKKGENTFSALVSLDLSGLGSLTKILSSSADNLNIFENIYQSGMKPEEWIYEYMEKAV